ncbi:uncharacterized protein KY384_001674 [Bacidia gigantensis]|uniref:uncharacterized protein n=1 Tax=Bacidia gigantensis TaxID=2732470 RepID=UPI001D03E4B6|nr:uncharacterized protein KY384_001674 [Bacidia gigantensis]KAG8533933.1 hypothetical protein KY384_001674 [Bacidia gigantensis]
MDFESFSQKNAGSGPLRQDKTLQPQNGQASPEAKPSHHRIVLADPVAFRYLNKDPSTKSLVYRERLHGYELYAVEQWACSRKHPTFVIVTYTGQEQHSVVCYVLSVPADEEMWSPRLRVYIKAVRRYHARAKETPLGTMMVTNLSSFPSALTVVAIPDGDLRSHREAFVLNEDLKRLGCTGRAGLNLSPPIGATQAKFRELYHTSEQIPIAPSVVELVKLCQAALMIFGKLPAEYADGLLCDVTEEKISDWWADIGADFFDIDATDGILGPTTVAALLGLLMGARGRLHSYGAPVAKDVFDIIATKKRAISYFQKSQKLERTRRLDHRTLDRLHKVTAKAANSEGRAVPRVVKSTVAELSGKGRDLIDGREGASIVDIETFDIDEFIKLGYGERFKWLWHGKPRKHETDLLTGLGDDLVFNGDEQGGGWVSSKKRGSVDDDISVRQTLSDRLYMTSHGSQTSLDHVQPQSLRKAAARNIAGKHDSRSGLGKIRDAVARRGHHHRMSKDADAFDSQSSRLMTPRDSLEQARDDIFDTNNSRKPEFDSGSQSRSGSQRSSPRDSRMMGDSQSKTRLQKSVYGDGSAASYSLSSSSVDNPITNDDSEVNENYVKLLNQADGITFRDRAHRPKMPDRDGTMTVDDMQAVDNMESFDWAASKLPGLRATRSMSTLFRKAAGKHWERRYPRRMSFSIMSDVLAHDLSGDDDDESMDPDALLAHELLAILRDRRMDDKLYNLKNQESNWIESKIGLLESYDEQSGKTQSKIDEFYHQKVNENHSLHKSIEALMTEKKGALTDGMKDIEILEAKLEYELQALQSKVEDAEDGVDEFERQILQLEARAAELDETPPQKPSMLRTVMGLGVL